MALSASMPSTERKVSVLAAAQEETDRAFEALTKEMRDNHDETSRRFDLFDSNLAALGSRLTLEIGLVNRKLDNIEQDSAYVKEHVFLLTGMVTNLDKKVTGIDTRLGAVETKVDVLESKVDSIDTRLGNLESKVDAIDTRLGTLETKVDAIDTRLGTLETKVDALEGKVDAIDTKLDSLGDAVAELLVRIPVRN